VSPVVRVVPDVPSFAVDDGFWYSVPDHLAPDIAVGSIVRVPLSGRRVRGWVVQSAERRQGSLKDVASISGNVPVFDERLLRGLTWAANHYVAPISTLLARATPPNLPRSLPGPAPLPGVQRSSHPISNVVTRSAQGKSTPVTALVSNWHRLDWIAALAPILESGGSVLVIAASSAEVDYLGTAARGVWGDAAVTVSGEDDAGDTAAWEHAQSSPRLVIGTPKAASWMVRGLSLAIVLEESRRAMKDRQTPTIHVRDLIRTRSRLEGFNLVFYGPTPGVELLAEGAEVITPGIRAWSLVEVVDRSEEGPGSGFISARTMAAIASTASAGNSVFVFTHRRVGSGSQRCTNCRTLRQCGRCGTRLGRVEHCPRCGADASGCTKCGGTEFEEMGTIPERLVAEINRKLGRGVAVAHPGDSLVTVGTERDLSSLEEVTLAVAADVDGMLMGIGYRTTEEALRQLARLASLVSPKRGSRLMLQTSHPDSPLVTTMRRGDPIPYLERVLVGRAREGVPPSTEMIALEVRGEVPDSVTEDMAALGSEATVLGPMHVDEGLRWLLTGKLGKTRLELRKSVGRWRDKGATVRVDVDPIDV
jgi:primosomal protein N' (replication factor Y)